MKIGLEQLLGASSRLLVRREQSYMIHINSVEFSGHSANMAVDVIDQLSLTPGCTCLSGMTARCDEGTC